MLKIAIVTPFGAEPRLDNYPLTLFLTTLNRGCII